MITTWGCCYGSERIIRISRFFQSRPQAELEAVMLHEMIHIRVRGHGGTFRKELQRVGLPGDVEGKFPYLSQMTHALRRGFRYEYECPLCKIRIRRRRKIRGFCARCYDEGTVARFRLIGALNWQNART